MMIGTDQEVLLKDHTGKYISSIGLIGGSKAEPLEVECGNLQEDNVLAEFAIPPANSKEEFIAYINKTFGILQAKVKEYDLEIDIKPSAVFDHDQLDNNIAKEFGCDPDYNAYTFEPNIAPKYEEVGALRSCGGHVHVSNDDIAQDENSRAEFVRILDLLLGVPSVVMDDDKDRRKLYGKAGAYRPKSYGIEYRTLSNFWIRTEDHMSWVWDQVKRAEKMFKEGFRINYETGCGAIECINNGDIDTARELIHEFKLEVV